MRTNTFRSGFLELLSSCVVHILYFDDFHSTPHSPPPPPPPPPPKCTKVTKMGHRMLQLAPYFSNPHTHLPTAAVVFLQNQKPTKPKRNSNSLFLLFAFLLMNSPGKQAVLSPGSINQHVEIALLFLCVCF